MLEVSADELAPLNRHTVKKGETLLSISKKLKVSRADLAEANYLSTKASLKAGQQLIIPRAPTLLLARTPRTDVSGGRNTGRCIRTCRDRRGSGQRAGSLRPRLRRDRA